MINRPTNNRSEGINYLNKYAVAEQLKHIAK